MGTVASETGLSLPTRLPEPRGPLTRQLFEALCSPPHPVRWEIERADLNDKEDLHLALYCCYELHYQGLSGVDPEWEWEPSLLDLRRRLESAFLAQLVTKVGTIDCDARQVVPHLWVMAADDGGPSLSRWVAEQADLDQVREFAIHRSAYQLKEADPHTWGIPRLRGEPKAAMVAIQTDEYGGGVARRMHATLFARTMIALGLDPAADYLDVIPGLTLATTNLISFFGLHRRWRGALVGHLALFEMTSVEPMGRYASALRRLGVSDIGWEFYDVHVEADQIHQHIAADGLVGGLLRREPHLARDVLFGAGALHAVEVAFSRHLLARWQTGCSSLRAPCGYGRDVAVRRS